MAIQLEGQIANRYYNPAGRDVSGNLSGILDSLSNRKTAQMERDIVSEDQRKQALVEDFAQVASLLDAKEPEQALAVLDERIGLLTDMGLDPSHTKDLRKRILDNPESARLGVQSVLDMAEATGRYENPMLARLKLQLEAQKALKGSPAQFGSSVDFKDSEGNLFTGTQIRDPGTGKVRFEVVPVPGSPEKPVGGLSRIDSAGRTSGDRQTEKTNEVRIEQMKDYASRAAGVLETVAIYKDIAEKLKNPEVRTGQIFGRLPTITAATAQIETLGRDLGLNLISAGSFGPLSEGEMKLAMDQGLPDENLSREELRKWVLTRGKAKAKLASHLRSVALKLASGEMTQSELVETITQERPVGQGGENDPLGLR